jgi:[CysO sulfur-carrier protein]-S-L-cysteine hydrolase
MTEPHHLQKLITRRRAIAGAMALGACYVLGNVVALRQGSQRSTVIMDEFIGHELVIPSTIVDVIVHQAISERPYEACGLVAGVGNRVMEYYPATNAEKSPTRYRIGIEEQDRIIQSISDRDMMLLSVVHSHPYSPAYPSPLDVASATFPGIIYLIVSVVTVDQPVIRGFNIVYGNVSEIAVIKN